MSVYSSAFANYYDRLIGRDKIIIKTTTNLLRHYAPKSKSPSLLELACGTGNVLQELPSKFELFGLDIAPSMLEIAKKKIPSATFFLDDMTKFNLHRKFDVIICIFDSVNHLTTWQQWVNFFKHSAKHLEKGGIFIFDMNTMRRMALLATFKPYVEKINSNTVAFIKVYQHKKTVYRGNFVILENIKTKNPIAFEEIVDEAVFPKEKVKKELQKYFTIEKMADPFREKVTSETGRIFFVCRRF